MKKVKAAVCGVALLGLCSSSSQATTFYRAGYHAGGSNVINATPAQTPTEDVYYTGRWAFKTSGSGGPVAADIETYAVAYWYNVSVAALPKKRGDSFARAFLEDTLEAFSRPAHAADDWVARTSWGTRDGAIMSPDNGRGTPSEDPTLNKRKACHALWEACLQNGYTDATCPGGNIGCRNICQSATNIGCSQYANGDCEDRCKVACGFQNPVDGAPPCAI